jgi:multidrug efflux pump subunit AcrA (membrane-fusion protein)
MAEQQIPPPPDSSASSQQQQQQQQQQGELPAAQQLEQLKAEKERKDRIEASVLRLDAAINAAKQLNADESQLVAANAKNMDLYFQIQATLKEINTHLGELGHGIPPTEIRAITRKLYDYIDDMDKILQKTVPDMNLPEDVKASHMEAFKEPVVHRDKLLSIFASGTAMSNAREARAALDRERAELEKARAAEKAQYEKDKMDWEAASKKRQRDEEEAQLAAAKRQRTEQSNGYLSSFTLKSLETPAAPTGSVPPATATFPLGINFAQGAAANNIAHAPRSISIGASKMTITRQYPLDGLAAVPKRDYAISNAFILREPSEMSALEQKRLRTFQAARDNLMNLKLTIPYDNAVATHSQFQHDTDVHT